MMVIRFMPGSRGKKTLRVEYLWLRERIFSRDNHVPLGYSTTTTTEIGVLLQTGDFFPAPQHCADVLGVFRNNDSPCGQERINTSSSMLHLLHRLQSSTLPSPSFPIFPPSLPPLPPSVFVAAVLWISHTEKLGLISITRDLFPIS